MFGGIILIFILVSILSQFSAQEKITEIIDKEKKQGGVTREVWEQQEQRIAALKRESDEWLAKVGVLTKTGSVEKLPDIGLLYEELQKAESKRKDLAQKLKDVTNKLAEAKTERTGVIAEESDRTPVFCALRFGQFFAIHDVSSPAIPRTHSDRQSDLVTHADGKFEVRLKRDVGQTV
ncbi:MAG: hypothetical protein FJY66_03300, partial [Calditrichaeota bacterium]|nr:hypothetical protein [Calditrichota bacterium]